MLFQDTAVIMSIEGREYPVDVFYSVDPVPDYLKGTVETVLKIHRQSEDGDVLCFLTGQEEVENVVSLLIEEARKLSKDAQKLMVLPMYGSLPASEQLRVFHRTPNSTRKIVVATNIAETSITINGVVYVVDCGFVKIKAFNPQVGIESLVIVPLSRASAVQRAGRAGRVRSGKAYRLYTEEDFCKLATNTVPEMQRTSMAGVILQLKAMGIDNVLRFDFLSPPPAQNMVCGLELLFALGGIDENARLTTPLGIQMAELPVDPMMAKMLLSSEEFGCSEEVVTIAAMMQIQNVFITPYKQKSNSVKAKRKFSCEEGDHLSLLNVYNAFIKYGSSSRWCHANFLNYKGLCRATEIRLQLKRILKRSKVKLLSCGGDVDAIRKCICTGFFANAARYHYSGVFKTVRDDHSLLMHPTSVLYPEPPPNWVVFNEIVHTSKEFMRDVTVIKAEWLHDLAPHYYEFGTQRELLAKRAKTQLV